MVGRQTPILALLVPFVMVFVIDGRRGLREAWPAALVAGADLRAGAVRRLQLRQLPADRHPGLAGLGRRCRGADADLVSRRDRRGGRFAPRHRRRCHRASRASSAGSAPRRVAPCAPARPGGLRPLRDHHHRARRRSASTASPRSSPSRPPSSAGRGCTSSAPRASRPRARSSSWTGSLRPAPGS